MQLQLFEHSIVMGLNDLDNPKLNKRLNQKLQWQKSIKTNKARQPK